MIDWKEKYMRDVEGLNNEGDPIGGDSPSGLRAALEALQTENFELKLKAEIYEASIKLFEGIKKENTEQKS